MASTEAETETGSDTAADVIDLAHARMTAATVTGANASTAVTIVMTEMTETSTAADRSRGHDLLSVRAATTTTDGARGHHVGAKTAKDETTTVAVIAALRAVRTTTIDVASMKIGREGHALLLQHKKLPKKAQPNASPKCKQMLLLLRRNAVSVSANKRSRTQRRRPSTSRIRMAASALCLVCVIRLPTWILEAPSREAGKTLGLR
jgi:hypothetical protein